MMHLYQNCPHMDTIQQKTPQVYGNIIAAHKFRSSCQKFWRELFWNIVFSAPQGSARH